MKRFENFKVNGKETAYRYMGTFEDVETISAFYSKEDIGASYYRSILDTKPYEEWGKNRDYLATPIEHCKGINCKYFAECQVKDKGFDALNNCVMGEYPMDKRVTQYVVYYNELINSAIVFMIHPDYYVDDYGLENISDIVDDIYMSDKSTYRFFQSDFSFEVAMEKENNVICTSYSNSDGGEDMEWVSLNYRSLEGKKIMGIIDILKVL